MMPPTYGLSGHRCLRGGLVPDHAHLDWVQAADRLSDASCDELIAACREFPVTPPVIVGQEDYGGHRELVARKIGPNDRTAWAFEIVGGVAADAARNHFRLEVTSITRAPQYVEYTPGRGHFGWHNDYSHGLADAPRKLTVIIQLSDPEDYDGGRLQMFGITVEELPRERGTILVFPSLVYHQITPVTRGLRRALVAWIAGPRIR
jgi:PKHD-type hydroxylase